MSSSDEEESLQEEKWDDMAIVRAFEDAMRGKQGEKKVSPTPEKKPRARKEASRLKHSVESARGPAAAHAWTPCVAASSSTGVNGVNAHTHAAHAQLPQTQSQEEIYQAAYAHAYAHLQAQSPAGYYQNQPIPTPTYPPQQGGYNYPPQPQWNAGMQAPVPPMMHFPSTGSGVPPGFVSPGGSQDDLANLLMSWYQSGYYTGRYQAMQEMRGKTSR